MKKVLILAYDFPPYVSVGGLRPFSWYKYFKEFGLHPVVVTRQWQNMYKNKLDYINKSESKFSIIDETEFGTIIRAPFMPNIANKILLKHGEEKFSFLRKLFALYFEFFQFVFPIGNRKNLYLEANKYLKTNKVDYIIATGEPFVLFHYANKLSKKFHVPWAADYRDPWALNTFNFVNPIIKPWFKYHERKLLKETNQIVTVSNFLGQSLNKYNKNDAPIIIIPNGFDLDNMSETFGVKQNSIILTFAYAGTIYPYHPYEDFFAVLNECLEENKSFSFNLNFYGINLESEIRNIIDTKYKAIKGYVKFYPRLENKDLLIELAKANIMVLFNEYSFMGTKIYDYLGVKRHILHCFTNDSNALELKRLYFPMYDDAKYSNKLQQELIESTNSGVSISDKNMLKIEILRLYHELHKNGMISLNSNNILDFSRKSQAKKLSDAIIKEIQKM